MSKLTPQEKIEAYIGKLNAIISAHEDLILKLFEGLGKTPQTAYELIQEEKKKKIQEWYEFVEDADPELAAKIDWREIKNL